MHDPVFQHQPQKQRTSAHLYGMFQKSDNLVTWLKSRVFMEVNAWRRGTDWLVIQSKMSFDADSSSQGDKYSRIILGSMSLSSFNALPYNDDAILWRCSKNNEHRIL